MAKQLIVLGSVVDDYTGDYLRKGGQKINDNFEDIYSELGDTTNLHAAGAWKTFAFGDSSPEGELLISFGEQYNINTTAGPCQVILPVVTPTDVGRVCAIRDVHGIWSTNSCMVVANPADGGTTVTTSGISATSVEFTNSYSTIYLVYSESNDWKYIWWFTIYRL
jgi:hypothetical protein